MRRLSSSHYDRHPYRSHPLAAALPEMDKATFMSLLDSIWKNGVAYPITFYEGMILDGRARYEACCRLGKPSPYRIFDGTEEEAEKLYASLNLMRRHMSVH